MGRGSCRSKRGRHESTTNDGRARADADGIRACSLALRALALAGAAVGALAPARAVTLGEVVIDSRLGEPLNASVPITLASGEFLGTACVSAPAGTGRELARLPQPQVRVPEARTSGTLALQITTAQPLYEPMYELQLQVRCPGTALLVRHYVLMLELPGRPAPETQPAPGGVAGEAVAPAATQLAPMAPTPRRRRTGTLDAAQGTPITAGSRYRVSSGDTLSTISARVTGRSGSLWALADSIFAANPQAFIAGSQDLIKLGSEIVIPAATGTVSAPAAAAGEAPPRVEPPVVSTPLNSGKVSAIEPENPDAWHERESVTAVDTAPTDTSKPVFADEQPNPLTPSAGTASADDAAPAPAVRTMDVADSNGGAPAWLAALIGVLVGGLVCLALLRERLTDALRSLLPERLPPASHAGATVDRPALQAVSKRMLPAESTMVVEEHALYAEPGHAEHAMPAMRVSAPAPISPQQRSGKEVSNSELSSLFDDVAVEEALADGTEEVKGTLDLDLTEATRDATVDEDIGWIGDETAFAPVASRTGTARTNTGQVDLQSLSQRATDDAQISQTLEDALNLLESDYEDELTASQVIDRTKLREALDGDETLARTGTDRTRR